MPFVINQRTNTRRMGNFIKKLGLLIVAVVLILQFIPVDRTNPEIDKTKDFLTNVNASPEISNIIKTSCYDCHSNHTVWPWYSFVAPVSWVVADHVEHGRKELNFSEWTDFEFKRKDHKLEECVEAIEEGWMPDGNYVKMHEEANLTSEQRELLIAFFKDARSNLE